MDSGRLGPPQPQDLGPLLDVCLAVSKERLLVQTHKHTDRLEEFALRHKRLL